MSKKDKLEEFDDDGEVIALDEGGSATETPDESEYEADDEFDDEDDLD